MSTVNDFPEVISRRSHNDTRVATAVDYQANQRRNHVDIYAHNEAKVAWEQNYREMANMEIGRSRNLSIVV